MHGPGRGRGHRVALGVARCISAGYGHRGAIRPAWGGRGWSVHLGRSSASPMRRPFISGESPLRPSERRFQGACGARDRLRFSAVRRTAPSRRGRVETQFRSSTTNVRCKVKVVCEWRLRCLVPPGNKMPGCRYDTSFSHGLGRVSSCRPTPTSLPPGSAFSCRPSAISLRGIAFGDGVVLAALHDPVLTGRIASGGVAFGGSRDMPAPCGLGPPHTGFGSAGPRAVLRRPENRPAPLDAASEWGTGECVKRVTPTGARARASLS